jgi:hypothetical protein
VLLFFFIGILSFNTSAHDYFVGGGIPQPTLFYSLSISQAHILGMRKKTEKPRKLEKIIIIKLNREKKTD